ncbi:hypothetical protein KIH39_16165 [Telmatocola sphagniphila]|uniref:Uncharacterized protein n=1 Tax=Telmatocola sphagniphila TaxID=1123043 RepID=A0A8E6B320_9BACT|nr:hypothetical protein [Telmatocola sphagniphila]QVL30384.1 hypothetical protein KIH39_16165 [Telmatocola sphagniphila]
MGWAEHRIGEFHQGRSSNWMERRALEHANPVHLILSVLAMATFIYGCWMHEWIFIGLALVLSIVGHVYCWTFPEKGEILLRAPTFESNPTSVRP